MIDGNNINHTSLADNSISGFRLQYLEVFNWGTFSNKIWRIEPNGNNSLLTGDIGSGKSTLVDALTCLLVPHQKITFNKAAGAETKERTLKTYIKGEYKKEKIETTNTAKEVYLRPNDNTYTILIANFYNSGYNENITLSQLFWLKDDKPEKLLLISSKPLSIKEHFSNFTDIPELRKRLRKDESIELFDDNFSKYSERFRRLFGMNSDKAIDLFYQTVSMKSVSSLNEFVREHMLEKTDVKARVEELKKRFEELTKAHEAVVFARQQKEILQPLAQNALDFYDTDRRIKELQRIIELIPGWFAEKRSFLLEDEIKLCNQKLGITDNQLKEIEETISELKNKDELLWQSIYENGGKRLEEIQKEINQREQLKEQKFKKSGEYNTVSTKYNIVTPDDESTFYANIGIVESLILRNNETKEKLVKDRDELKIKERQLKEQIDLEHEELISLKSRKTQIPGYMISLRQQIVEDLAIDESDIPFIGELMQINESELEWEGAIERLLHDFGLSMLVPISLYGRLSNYINQTVLKSKDGKGRKLDYYPADVNQSFKVIKEIDERSVINKIDIKPDSPYLDWVAQELAGRYDFICVDINEFRRLPYAMTKEGQIKSGGKRHQKDDRRSIYDRNNYVLGWSNEEKIKYLEQSIQALETEYKSVGKSLTQISVDQNNCSIIERDLNELLRVKDYAEINWQKENVLIVNLRQEQKDLENTNDTLKVLNKQREEVKLRIKDYEQKEKDKREELGQIKQLLKTYGEQLDECRKVGANISQTDKENYFPQIQEKMPEQEIRLKEIDNSEKKLLNKFTGDGGELTKANEDLRKVERKIITGMKDIKQHSASETSEMPVEIDALPEYIKMYEKIFRDDLPRHEKRFKDELTKNTINSIAIFHNKLEGYEKDILEKVKQINKHLIEIEYNSGTYIEIQTDRAQDPQISDFKEDLKNCYTHSFTDAGDFYNEEKYKQVKKILDRFYSGQSSDIEWTNKVTDVRKWFDFNASERYLSDNSEKEFYPGSSGKSGGQKEKLAYTILASALAFQFGLAFGESKSRSFRFVVIDEAFGRGSDDSTRYGLELFKKLDLQLLIVTPLQKINIIENYVNAVHFVSNKEGNNSQIRNLTYEEYMEEKIKRKIEASA